MMLRALLSGYLALDACVNSIRGVLFILPWMRMLTETKSAGGAMTTRTCTPADSLLDDVFSI
jgi:hypothetical protein